MRLSIWLVLAVALTGCHSRNVKKSKKEPFLPDSVQVKLPDTIKPKLVLAWQKFDWKTFSAKSNTSYADGKHSYDFRMHIRMEKGKFIWISASLPLGIEIARAYIGRDTIKVMDRINGTFLITNYAYLQSFTSAPLNLDMLQALLIGTPTFNPENGLLDTAAGWMSATTVDLGLTQIFYTDLSTKHLVKNLLSSAAMGQEIKVDYDRFEPVDGYYLPTNLQVNGHQGVSNMDAELTYSNVVLNKTIEAPFKIPESYSPMKP